MSSGGATGEPAGIDVGALELFVELLSQADAVSTGDEFYGRLCEAVCRLVGMRRAVIFRYDTSRRRVRAAGAHGLDLAQFAGARVTVESAPIAARALQEDSVIELSGDVSGEFPAEYAALVAEPMRLVCAPMTAAGLAIGVIFADRPLSAQPLDDAGRDLLWTLGKARRWSRSPGSSRHRPRSPTSSSSESTWRARFTSASSSDCLVSRWRLTAKATCRTPRANGARTRPRRRSPISASRSSARWAGRRAPTGTTFMAEVERLARVHPDLGVTIEPGSARDVPPALEPLAQSVLAEAVRNAHKHARPTRVSVRIGHTDGTFVLEVANDGVIGHRRRAGMGLRLAGFEALQSGGVVEFGEREPGTWQVRLVVPDDG